MCAEVKPEGAHRTFQLTAERDLSTRYRIARMGIILYFFTFFASCIALCDCPGFFAVMAVCALVSLICGSSFQRLLSAGLLLLAVAGFFYQLHQERGMEERVRDTLGLYYKKLREQKNGANSHQ